MAPDFTLITPKGNTVSLSDFEGTPVVLNVWATWCPPCREELPLFARAYRELNPELDPEEVSEAAGGVAEAADTQEDKAGASAPKVQFLILNNMESPQIAREFLEVEGLSDLTALIRSTREQREAFAEKDTPLDEIIDVLRAYKVRGMPSTYFISEGGELVHTLTGFVTPQTLREGLATIGVHWP